MNFYQNTNSRANHHYVDHRVYPTKVSNKNASSTNATSLIGAKGKQTGETNIKMGLAPPSQSAGQYKTYSSVNPTLVMGGVNYPTYP